MKVFKSNSYSHFQILTSALITCYLYNLEQGTTADFLSIYSILYLYNEVYMCALILMGTLQWQGTQYSKNRYSVGMGQ